MIYLHYDIQESRLPQDIKETFTDFRNLTKHECYESLEDLIDIYRGASGCTLKLGATMMILSFKNNPKYLFCFKRDKFAYDWFNIYLVKKITFKPSYLERFLNWIFGTRSYLYVDPQTGHARRSLGEICRYGSYSKKKTYLFKSGKKDIKVVARNLQLAWDEVRKRKDFGKGEYRLYQVGKHQAYQVMKDGVVLM